MQNKGLIIGIIVVVIIFIVFIVLYFKGKGNKNNSNNVNVTENICGLFYDQQKGKYYKKVCNNAGCNGETDFTGVLGSQAGGVKCTYKEVNRQQYIALGGTA